MNQTTAKKSKNEPGTHADLSYLNCISITTHWNSINNFILVVSPSPALGGTAGDWDCGSALVPPRRLGPPLALRAAARPAAWSPAAAAAASPPWRGEAAEGRLGG